MLGRARAAAEKLLARNVEVFERLGYQPTDRSRPLEARLERERGPALHLRMAPKGRIFGGAYALELAPAEPPLPKTGGLAGRPRGVVRLERVAFRARRGDEAGAHLARSIERDEAVQRALALVHFERVRVDAEGRPVIRHMGGSLVWILFPPLVRPVPLDDEQARASVAALDALAAVARS